MPWLCTLRVCSFNVCRCSAIALVYASAEYCPQISVEFQLKKPMRRKSPCLWSTATDLITFIWHPALRYPKNHSMPTAISQSWWLQPSAPCDLARASCFWQTSLETPSKLGRAEPLESGLLTPLQFQTFCFTNSPLRCHHQRAPRKRWVLINRLRSGHGLINVNSLQNVPNTKLCVRRYHNRQPHPHSLYRAGPYMQHH